MAERAGDVLVFKGSTAALVEKAYATPQPIVHRVAELMK